MNKNIAIKAIGLVSPLGGSLEDSWLAYQDERPYFTFFGEQPFERARVSALGSEQLLQVADLRKEEVKYKPLDPSVLYAMLASRRAVAGAGWQDDQNIGINLGSSRGATHLFEQYYQEFRERGHASTLASPTTTLGNLSSWVAHDLKSKGPAISHSITCSSALHAILNAVAWIGSGMSQRFLAGGVEACLTPFTIAQMQALKIYSDADEPFPCKAGDSLKTRNTMILGEGAAVLALEAGNDGLATILGVGYATETLTHNISISTEAKCFQDSMRMALGSYAPEEVDAIVTHTPGTVKGDLAELAAIRKVFGKWEPMVTNNKWKIGHTFGASGALSLELAVIMLRYNSFVPVPFVPDSFRHGGKPVRKVMVNAVGFGGNAVSILLGN